MKNQVYIIDKTLNFLYNINIMNNKYLEKLEFNKIKETLSTFCTTYIGKDLSLNLLPSNKKQNVLHMLSETEEAVNMVYRNTSPSFINIANISIHLKILESYGILSIKYLLDLANIFKTANDLKIYFNKDFIDINEYPILNELFKSLYSNLSITEKIFTSILDENTIDDKASSKLNSIRKKERKIENDIKSKLNNMIHNSSFSKYIQDSIVTIRNDRYVIPIKEEYRSNVKGFVHDVSNGGSTVFIEPSAIFDLNSELTNLKIEEDLEIEKILQELSKLFYPFVNELKHNIEVIGKLDFIFAKAKYSKLLNGITPEINDKKEINLINARHPLIESNKVVPISVNLGENFSILVITGPNTGGKTVTLKTVGLLECMACSGLNIPADIRSSIYVFDKIFADIGDNQSIADSLSTFSSHMINIVNIVENSTENSLILVDELGSGTDPLEGANLAISILQNLEQKGSLVLATTHYQELKKFALVTNNFQNASVEFDVNTLSPTYKLLVGIPGKSNAFEISRKLGLDESIIKNAKLLMSNNDINIEELLKSIYDNKSKIEKEKLEISEELKKISFLKKSLERDNSKLKNEELDIINKAKIKAREILLDAKEEVDDIIKEASTASNKDLNNLRNKLNSDIKNTNIINSANIKNNNPINVHDVQLNTEVFVTTLNQYGTIVSNISKNNEVQVQIGFMKMSINIKDLQKTNDNNSKKSVILNNSSYTSISKSKTANIELNIIGMNVEESIPIIDKFLDDSALAKLQNVRIVHGKGTGKLRDGVHKYLKKHPHVKSFRMGTFGEGEMGVTVVEIK